MTAVVVAVFICHSGSEARLGTTNAIAKCRLPRMLKMPAGGRLAVTAYPLADACGRACGLSVG